MKRFVIGDVHGCLDELKRLIEEIKPRLNDEDQLIFVGDLVDKGPDSPGVVQYVRELAHRHDTVLVMGNHEEKHCRFHKKATENRDYTKTKKWEEIKSIQDRLSDEDRAFLFEGRLCYTWPGYVVIHGGIPDSITSLGNSLMLSDLNSKKVSERYKQLLRTRYQDPNGWMVQLGQENLSRDSYWAETYDGRFGTAIYGHEAYHNLKQPYRCRNAIGIDLGCVYGNVLCCIEIQDSEPNYKTHIVPALSKYSKSYKEE